MVSRSRTVIARRKAPWQSLGDSEGYEIAALRPDKLQRVPVKANKGGLANTRGEVCVFLIGLTSRGVFVIIAA